ncbi:hypothetical protein [Cellulomonas carbonis]|uniref:Uncharacterized protein n=1 Tax=Cellulomonas carbonis T26 TaxID=947969 RepID=A0A0A0BT88_9CELL|nr:hypothetical protein [Cellulomonas carbonis]KGM11146.1 hypothetical protein N868_10080 [Cellulomonas carbonis T26]GGC05126.1 hypothetical protein GCM10010972_17900 [Cellulomonas carbonis]
MALSPTSTPAPASSAALRTRGARTRPTPRAARTLAAGAVVAAVLTGCSATNELTTIGAYDASDGVSASVGDVRVGNLVLVGEDEGEPGRLLGYVTHDGLEGTTVTLSLADGGEPVTVDLEPSGTVQLGDAEGDELVFESLPVIPGAVADLVVETELGETTTVPVPVLDGTLPEYADLVP